MSYTPGPWQVYEPSAMDHSGWEVFPCVDGTRIAMVRLEGDCRLIAAAPELADELAHLVGLLEPLEIGGSLNVPGLATLNKARALLARIRGER